jgi:ABC-2 type transport system permease protein
MKEMEHKASFFSHVAYVIFTNALFVVQWLVFFKFKNSIGGYELKDVLLLWSLYTVSIGLCHVFFENVFHIPHMIVTGKLDAYLVQPLNVLYNTSISKTNPSSIGDLIYGTIVAIMCLKTDFYQIILFLLFSFLSGVILTSFFIVIGSLTFWLKGGDHLIYTMSCAVFMTGTYPEGIFKGFMRILIYTALPIGFAFYVPIRIMLSFNCIYLLSVFVVAIFFVILAFYVFNRGLKIYRSGNLVNIRF